jgi:AraC-like DNA-binding protein
MDLMWIDGMLQVAGPDRTAQPATLAPGEEIVGVRFKPGVGPTVFGTPANELVDQRLEARVVWGGFADLGDDELADTSSSREAATVLQALVRDRLADAPPVDPVVRQLTSAVLAGDTSHPVRIDRIATDLGISERQLRRRCNTALGYGPKTFDRIARFQRFLGLARRRPTASLAELAATAGYVDQAHLAHDVRRLANASPTELIARP